MPVLLVCGDKDHPCPPEHQQLFFESIPEGDKEIIEITNADHNLRGVDSHQYGKELNQAKRHISYWLKQHTQATTNQ